MRRPRRMPRGARGGKSAGKKKEGGCREKRQARFSSHLPCAGRPAAFFAAFFCGRSGEKHGGGGRAGGGAGVRKRCPGLRRAGGALRAFFASGTAFGVLPQGGRAAGRWSRRRSSNPGRRAVHAEKTPLGHGRLVPRAFFYGRRGAEEGGRERRQKKRMQREPVFPITVYFLY